MLKFFFVTCLCNWGKMEFFIVNPRAAAANAHCNLQIQCVSSGAYDDVADPVATPANCCETSMQWLHQ
jgi:hypothetical protein